MKWWRNFLEKLAKENEKLSKGGKLSCCNLNNKKSQSRDLKKIN